MISTTLLAEKLFTGEEVLENQVVNIEAGKIVAISHLDNQSVYSERFPLVAPAFMDIQIYGAAGKLLAVYPTVEAISDLYQYCLAGGATHFQPTVATNTLTVFKACINAVKNYWNAGGKGCLGLHLEGPWINPKKSGAHIAAFIHSPTREEVTELLEYGKGVITMITLAPESCSKEIIKTIQNAGVLISAGHSDASYEQAMEAFNNGIHATTHLYNAMSPLQHRSPGMVGAIFEHPQVMASMVPDGYHVDFAALRIAKQVMKDRLFVITDAVTQTQEGPYPHQFEQDKYSSNGILSGSALNMLKALHNLVEKMQIPLDEALRMLSTYPARVMKKESSMGKIAVGFQANLVILQSDLTLIKTISAN